MFFNAVIRSVRFSDNLFGAIRSGNYGVQAIHTTPFLKGKDQVWHVINGASASLSAVAYAGKAVAGLGPAATFAVGFPFAF